MSFFGGGLFEFNYTLLFAMIQIGLLSSSLSTVFFGPIAKRLIKRKGYFFTVIDSIYQMLIVKMVGNSHLFNRESLLKENSEIQELNLRYKEFKVSFDENIKTIPNYYTNEIAKWRLSYRVKYALSGLKTKYVSYYEGLAEGSFIKYSMLENKLKTIWLTISPDKPRYKIYSGLGKILK